MSASRVQGCIVSLLLQRTPLAMTSSVEETASLLIRLAKAISKTSREQKNPEESYERVACVSSSVNSRKRDNVSPHLCYLQKLCQIPGISHTIAKSVANVYPNMTALCLLLESLSDDKVRVAKLMEVPMIGKTIAVRICNHIR